MHQKGRLKRDELAEKVLGRKQRGEIADRQLSIAEANQPWVKQPGTSNPDTLAKMLSTPEGTETAPQGDPGQDLQMANQEMSKQRETMAKSPVSAGEIALTQTLLKNKMKTLGVKFDEPAQEIADQVSSMKGFSKQQIFHSISENWPETKRTGLDKIKKAMEATQGMEEKLRLIKVYDEWDSGAVVKGMFPNVVAYEAAENAKNMPKASIPKIPTTIEGMVVDAMKNPKSYSPEDVKFARDYLAKKQKSSTGAQARAITTWRSPDGKIHNLPNNVAPPKGSLKVNVSNQELTSLRQDRAHIKRESSILKRKIAKAKKFPDIDMYQRDAESAKEQLESYNLELKDLKTRENELLGKKPKSKYKSADGVRDAYKAGNLTKKEAASILQEQFGYK